MLMIFVLMVFIWLSNNMNICTWDALYKIPYYLCVFFPSMYMLVDRITDKLICKSWNVWDLRNRRRRRKSLRNSFTDILVLTIPSSHSLTCASCWGWRACTGRQVKYTLDTSHRLQDRHMYIDRHIHSHTYMYFRVSKSPNPMYMDCSITVLATAEA